MFIVHGQLKKEDGSLVKEIVQFSETEDEAKSAESEVADLLEEAVVGDAVYSTSVYGPDKVKEFLESVTPETCFQTAVVEEEVE